MLRAIPRLMVIPVVGWCLTCGQVMAGWISISNDTNQTIVVQESITVNGQVRRCKPIKLAPGEILREYQTSGGTKTLTIHESGLFGKQLFSGELTWKDDTAFSIHKDADKIQVADAATLTAKAKSAVAKTETKPPAEKKPR